MKKILRNILIICLVGLAVISCRPRPGPPWADWRFKGPPPSLDGEPYPDFYVLGWKHGCETGTAAVSNSYYRLFYAWHQDPALARNRIYYQGWQDAYSYCNRYLYQYLSKPFL